MQEPSRLAPGRTTLCFDIKCLNLMFSQDQKFLVWFDFCFTALQHILGHFGRGQLT